MQKFIFALILLSSSAVASTWSDELKRSIDDKVAQNFENKSQVGIVVGVVKGDETYVWSYGKPNLESNSLPTGDTFFEMGSITKTYTATLLALEVLRNRVQLADPIKIFWKELEGTDAGEITLEQLATHSSGLPRMPDNFKPNDPLNPYKDYDVSLLFSFLKSFKQESKGPYPYDYSNVGVGLLGYLLSEKLNGVPYDQYLGKNLLLPLGLKDTKTQLLPGDLTRAAQGYGGFFELIPFWDLNVLGPAGVLKTTVNDLVKYMKFNMTSGTSDLSRAAAIAHQPRAATDDAKARIGLAWESTQLGDYQIITHGGATGGYRANLVFDPVKQLGAVLLSNTNMSPRCVIATVFGIPCEVPKWAVVKAEVQQNLLGRFRCEKIDMNAEVFFENGILGVAPEGQGKLRLWAKSDLEYSIPDADVIMKFHTDVAGKALSFTLTQGGRDFEFVPR